VQGFEPLPDFGAVPRAISDPITKLQISTMPTSSGLPRRGRCNKDRFHFPGASLVATVHQIEI
jgi:hypothetical protein